MLKVEINQSGQVFISGDKADLRDLRYQINEVIEHDMPMTKNYTDFVWNAHETREPSKSVTVSIK